MSDRFLKHGGASAIVKKLVVKAAYQNNLVEEGDRILIAVSGGKDSTVLAWALSSIRQAVKKNYTLAALHISSDFCHCCKKSSLEKHLTAWDIPFNDLFVPVIARLKPNEKMNCYWCSTQRRTELISYAIKHNFNKIALGHHLDDVIETYFMNMTTAGKLSGMDACMKYRKYPVTLIRPLVYLEERQVIACADEQGLLKSAFTCPYGRNSNRLEMRKRIAEFTRGSGSVKRRIYHALESAQHTIQSEY